MVFVGLVVVVPHLTIVMRTVRIRSTSCGGWPGHCHTVVVVFVGLVVVVPHLTIVMVVGLVVAW